MQYVHTERGIKTHVWYIFYICLFPHCVAVEVLETRTSKRITEFWNMSVCLCLCVLFSSFCLILLANQPASSRTGQKLSQHPCWNRKLLKEWRRKRADVNWWSCCEWNRDEMCDRSWFCLSARLWQGEPHSSTVDFGCCCAASCLKWTFPFSALKN